MKFHVIILFLFASSIQSLYSQQLRSRVIDRYSKSPLEGVTVEIGASKTITNSNGEFSINCVEEKNLKITSIGYLPKILMVKGCILSDVIELDQDQAQLEAIQLGTSASANKDLLSIPSSVVRMDTKELKRGNEIGRAHV